MYRVHRHYSSIHSKEWYECRCLIMICSFSITVFGGEAIDSGRFFWNETFMIVGQEVDGV